MNLKYQQLQDQLSSGSAPSHRMVLLSFSISFFFLIFSIKAKMNVCNCNQLGQLHRHRELKIIWVADSKYPSLNLYVVYDSPDGHNVPVDIRKPAVHMFMFM